MNQQSKRYVDGACVVVQFCFHVLDVPILANPGIKLKSEMQEYFGNVQPYFFCGNNSVCICATGNVREIA